MGPLLPLYTTPKRGELPYDNAKVRRRSSFKMAIQAGLAGGAGKRYMSCSIGKFLAFALLFGIGYLAVTHDSAIHSAKRIFKDPSRERFLSKGGIAGIWKRGNGRSDVGRKGGQLHENVTSNATDFRMSDQLNMEEVQWRNRQASVVEAFRHAWKGYKDFAMGFDELEPERRTGVDGLGGLGATIIDSLDTAIIMGCTDIVQDASSWIETELPKRLREKGQVNVFETTIRVLGGLLSAFHLISKDSQMSQKLKINPKILLDTAIDLGDRLYTAFSQSSTPIPYSDVNLSKKTASKARFNDGASSTSEATTLQMEFWYLSQLSGDPKYGKAAMGVIEYIRTVPKEQGLIPIFINPQTGQFQGNNIRLGSRGDSYYEYLLKVWLQQGGVDNDASEVTYLREMYEEAMMGVKNLLVRKSKPKGLVFVGELPNGIHGSFSPKMDHLVCFLAGTLAIGATKGLTKDEALHKGFMNGRDLEDLKLAEDLCHTCYQMYAVTATGLAPEIAFFNMDGQAQPGMDGGKPDAEYRDDILIHALDRHNLLRPETVESLFVLYRITGATKYREWGWNIFQAFESHTKVASGGYTSLSSVTEVPAAKRDKMETFFLGETLKYLYLLFSHPSVLPLDKYVFNTEAHPLPVIVEPGSGFHIKSQTSDSTVKINSSTL